MTIEIVTLTKPADHIGVRSPYNPELVQRCRDMNGKWYGESKLWVFPASLRDAVETMLRDEFGWYEGGETVSIRLRATREHDEYTAPVLAFGRVVAKAWGRDSGAKPGDGVSLLEGSIRSGGSMKNWRTIVSEGALFEVRDVPALAVANGAPDGWELVDAPADEQAPDYATRVLRMERDRLAARLAEIDSLLEEDEKND